MTILWITRKVTMIAAIHHALLRRADPDNSTEDAHEQISARGALPLDVTAGVCLSPRLAHLLSPQWRQMALRPGITTAADGLDLVLLEVREGYVPGWKKHESALVKALRQWADSDIPVVAWCTDDSYADIGWWDLVMAVAVTTEAARDVMHTRHDTVLLLPAAAQPRVHRPAGPSGARHGGLVVIDGFSGLTDNQALLDVLSPALAPIPESDLRMARVHGKSSPVTLPTPLADRIGRARDWIDIESDLGCARVGIDLSGTSSQAPWTTMAMACSGVSLVGATPLGTGLPGDVDHLVSRRGDSKALRSEIVARIEQDELAAREGHQLQRAVLSGHTAGHRVRTLVEAAGIEASVATRSVSAIVPTNRAHEIDNILANLGRQSHRDTELVLVLHGLAVSHQDLQARAADSGVPHLAVIDADRALTLGACMNLGVDASSGRYVAKMDDDNFYGEHYLTDEVHAFDYTSAGIVGKWCHYVWLRSTGAVVLRHPGAEHSTERRVQGGAMMFTADVARSLRFGDIPRGVDSDILDRAALEGVHIYSADRFNFVSIRGADRHAHTWTVQDSTFMTKTGRLMFYGDPRPHVSV